MHSGAVDVSNVRELCGPWRPLHSTFPQIRHLAIRLRSTGAVTWDAAQTLSSTAVVAQTAPYSGGGGGGRSSEPSAVATMSYSLRLLRDSVPRLKHLQSLDLTQCYLDLAVWSTLCCSRIGGGSSGGSDGAGLKQGLSLLMLHPAAALLFPGTTWGERLGVMLGQLAAAQPHVRVRVLTGDSGGRSGGGGGAGSCDVGGEAGLKKVH